MSPSLRARFVVPGPLDQRTGGYRYDARVAQGLREARWDVSVDELAGAFPVTDEAARSSAARALEACADDEVLVVDGLALPAFAGHAGLLASRRFVALVHHPLERETDLGTPEVRAELGGIERALVAVARRVIVTSPATAREIVASGVPDERVRVVVPGTDPAPLATGGEEPPVLLCVATLTPRKAHLVLLDALAPLAATRRFRLVCAGSTTRDPAHVARVRARLAGSALEGVVDLVGELDDAALARAYARADLFVLPSFHEGYGMALTEALARGLPIVACRAGAVPETVPAGAGVLVPPGDVEALRAAIDALLVDGDARAELAASARAARSRLPRWSDAARDFACVLAEVAA